ncbi:MAG: CPBP family intramembrane metalloprotease [Microcoleus vaginatus WJT46-NPBG5]|jgi:predicted Abi (CAAX) family protease|nr:CPBP family intramembrane metalloprotease [Microcoleus vaginatus WJT46-NPBG5]
MFLEFIVNFLRGEVIWHRLIAAVSTIPNAEAWLWSAALLGVYTLIALPVGFRADFIKVDIQKSWVVVIGVIVGSLLRPAITEELFFRVLLLPHATENASPAALWFWGLGSLVIFIVYHPLNAMTFFPVAGETFLNPIFLFLAALLGAICTISYWQSGSLWPPVVIHWVIVAVWLLLLGGYQKLYA